MFQVSCGYVEYNETKKQEQQYTIESLQADLNTCNARVAFYKTTLDEVNKSFNKFMEEVKTQCDTFNYNTTLTGE
jgi:uncharacterized coiled-coil DUF342 family protein